MGDFYEHVLFGFLSAAIILYWMKGSIQVGGEVAAVSVLLVFLGSVLPDIDNKNAYVHRAVKALVSIAAGLSALIFLPFSPLKNLGLGVVLFLAVYLVVSAAKIRHRGFTHTSWFCLILSSLTVIFGVFSLESAAPGAALGVGLFSHLLLDGEIL